MLNRMDKRSFRDLCKQFHAPKNYTGKVQIIRPSAVLSINTYSAPVTLPIGPAYLASVLREAGYRVGIIDAVGEDVSNIAVSDCGRFNIQGISVTETVNKIDADTTIVGISMMFSQDWIEHRKLVQAIRRARPDVKIVAGGEHVTALSTYVLKDCPELDYVIKGEGEQAFLELVYCLAAQNDITKVSSVSYIDENGEYSTTGLSPRIYNINELPRPAWDLCPVDSYFVDNWTMGISMGRNMPIVATRGCPYQCSFCSNPQMWTTRYVMRDHLEVVDEIEWLIKTYNTNSIDFFDLTAIIKKDWILKFCEELKHRNINIVWQLPSGTRSEALDADTLEAIYEAGCSYLVYAPESGSARTLQVIKKKIDLGRLTQSIRDAVRHKHTVKVNLIIGFPNETYSDVFRTILYTIKMAYIGAEDCNISLFSPYPGSALYEELRAENAIAEPNDEYFADLVLQFDFTNSESVCRNISGSQLKFFRIFGLGIFYTLAYTLHPSRIYRLVKNLFSPRFQANNLFEQRLSDALARSRIMNEKKT